MAHIQAPWTQEQVDALNAYQQAGLGHPFTCGNPKVRRTNHPDGEGVVEATISGWICSYCGYTQDWAHDFMIDMGQKIRDGVISEGRVLAGKVELRIPVEKKMKQQIVVRVILPDGVHNLSQDVASLLEQFRHAGMIQVHRNGTDGICFDMLPPISLGDNNIWAKGVAERMTSFFGYNAVVAPGTAHLKLEKS